MHRAVVLVVALGCGRIGFDATASINGNGNGDDGGVTGGSVPPIACGETVTGTAGPATSTGPLTAAATVPWRLAFTVT